MARVSVSGRSLITLSIAQILRPVLLLRVGESSRCCIIVVNLNPPVVADRSRRNPPGVPGKRTGGGGVLRRAQRRRLCRLFCVGSFSCWLFLSPTHSGASSGPPGGL